MKITPKKTGKASTVNNRSLECAADVQTELPPLEPALMERFEHFNADKMRQVAANLRRHVLQLEARAAAMDVYWLARSSRN
jgi:hypothetical protein